MLRCEVLGGPGEDNSLFVRLERRNAVYRLAFDAGEGCLAKLAYGEQKELDALFLSHLHLDHIAGFDTFVRANFNRQSRPVCVFGPMRTAELLQHRLCGTLWNLLGPGDPGQWLIHDIGDDAVTAWQFETQERFLVAHLAGARPFENPVWQSPDLRVEACILDHLTPCLAYHVAERDRVVIDTEALSALGLRPGPWCAEVKAQDERPDDVVVTVATAQGEQRLRLGELRERLLRKEPGQRVAYVTDTSYDDVARARLLPMITGADHLIAECSYLAADAELALLQRHMTTTQVGALARDAQVKELTLIHTSRRYEPEARVTMLAEVRALFAAAAFAPHWS
jgi:ribonuclease Z